MSWCNNYYLLGTCAIASDCLEELVSGRICRGSYA